MGDGDNEGYTGQESDLGASTGSAVCGRFCLKACEVVSGPLGWE